MNLRITQEALRNFVTQAENGRVVVFDTETTGISKDDEIVQLAAAEYVSGELARTFNAYVIPTCMIHPEAEAVHHLSMEFLVANGVAPVTALAQFFEFLGRDALLVGHNVHFDLRMIQTECRKFDFVAEPEGISFCDTLALAKRLVPGLDHYRLGFLIEALGLRGTNSHNALDDTLACGELFFDLVHRIPIAPEDYIYEPFFD